MYSIFSSSVLINGEDKMESCDEDVSNGYFYDSVVMRNIQSSQMFTLNDLEKKKKKKK